MASVPVYPSNPNDMWTGSTNNRRVYGKGWHAHPGMFSGGLLTFERKTEDDPIVYMYGEMKTTMDSRSYGNYGYDITVELHIGTIGSASQAKENWNFGAPGSSYETKTITIKSSSPVSFTLDSNSQDVYVVYFCNNHSVRGGCDVGTPYCNVFTLKANSLPYEPYKKPTIAIGGDNISRYDVERSIGIEENRSGDGNATKVTVTVNGYTSGDIGISNNSGNYNFKPSDKGVSDGQDYKVYATRTHSKKSDYATKSNELTLYTYRTPVIKNLNINEGNSNVSGFGNITLSWDTNGRRWNDAIGESAFETYIRFGTSDVWFKANNQEPINGDKNNSVENFKQTLNETHITTYLTELQRCSNVVNTKMYMRRRNPSSDVNSGVEKNISIQFTPKYSPLSLLYWDYDSSGNNNRGNSISEGSTLYTDEHPTILVDWEMEDLPDRGVIDGFELIIYENSSYSTKFKTFDVKSSSHDTLYGQKSLNIKSDLKRGQMNYVGVKAYYLRPDGVKVYGPELRKIFIRPVGKLATPRISYPINNTQWHNKNFRILFELPEDYDSDVFGGIISNDTYRYKEIELVINETTYTYTENPNIFSVDKLGYRYRVCINPSLISTHPDTDNYKIKLRVQKNYYTMPWSNYSNEVNLGKIPVNNLDLKQYEYILDTHYKYVRNASVRLHSVYPIKTLPINNVDQNKGDVIYAKHYQGIYDTILQIQTEVNNWARFDSNRNNVKFNQTINEMSGSNNPKQDFITAVKDDRPNREGRNYKNILIDCMNKLK